MQEVTQRLKETRNSLLFAVMQEVTQRRSWRQMRSLPQPRAKRVASFTRRQRERILTDARAQTRRVGEDGAHVGSGRTGRAIALLRRAWGRPMVARSFLRSCSRS